MPKCIECGENFSQLGDLELCDVCLDFLLDDDEDDGDDEDEDVEDDEY